MNVISISSYEEIRGRGAIMNKCNISEKALLTVKEMKEYTGLGENTVRRLLRDPYSTFTVRVGKKYYANRRQLDKWLDQLPVIDERWGE